MRIKPIQPSFRSFDKDERHAAEEKRIQLLLTLLYDMNIPQSRVELLKLRQQRPEALCWLHRNLVTLNSHHKNYIRAKSIIDLLLRSECKKQ